MNLDAEWLEPDGAGGFASGTVGGARSRRYHALLLPATQPPVGRMALINGLEVWAETADGARHGLSTQRYDGGAGEPDVLQPRGQDLIIAFQAKPWPTWTFELPNGTQIEQEIFVHQATRLTAICWRLARGSDVQIEVRPLFSGRDYHATHHENAGFDFTPVEETGSVLWKPYPGVPGSRIWCNGTYRHDPSWYRNFVYLLERERGLDFLEDLASPGVFAFTVRAGQNASVLLGATDLGPASLTLPPGADAGKLLPALRTDEERRRERLAFPFAAAAEVYIARGARGATILAGYPWFTDWGRDTFISLRGLCLATRRFDLAREILLQWTGAVSEGMLPNRFPDSGAAPEYNSVDASLWFIIAAHDYLAAAPRPRDAERLERWAADQTQLLAACESILAGYANGTRFGIRADPADGLLFAGQEGYALTWMDAVCDGIAFTSRIGKPVEVQALWLNALWLMAPHSARWQPLFEQGCRSFTSRFWNPDRRGLYDVVDCHGRIGEDDASLRPNQLFAIGGLPLSLLPLAQARSVVDLAEAELLTPMGLRTLGSREPDYTPRYVGDRRTRDAAYHQGTVWPWLLGAFVEAWVRVRGDTGEARAEARERFVAPLLRDAADHPSRVPEIADAEPPHLPRGCPFQAWSVAELARLSLTVLR